MKMKTTTCYATTVAVAAALLSGQPVGYAQLTPAQVRSDFNGDGISDLVVGASSESIGANTKAGAVHVLYGSPLGATTGGGSTGVPATQFIHQDQPGMPGNAESGDRFGLALASGDFNGDGFDDLAIGVPFEDTDGTGTNSGLVQIVFGGPNGLDVTRTQDLSAVGSQEEFGFALAAGDFNDDGVDDLAIGAPNRTVPSDYGNVRGGGVTVRYGERNVGVGTRADHFRQRGWEHLETFGAFGDHPRTGERFGEVLAAGDLNVDGPSDLVVGVPLNDRWSPGNLLLWSPEELAEDTGCVHILFGDDDGLARQGTLSGGADGETYPHWFVSKNVFTKGRALYLRYDSGGREVSGDRFGHAVAIGRRNGPDHLYVGSPGGSIYPALVAAGDVFEFRGFRDSGPLLVTRWSLNSPGINGVGVSGDLFGFALASGDFNDDGAPDLAVGSPFKDVEHAGVTYADAGTVNVIYGNPDGSGLHATGDQVWHQGLDDFGGGSPNADGHFGRAVTAFNFGNGAAFDLAIGAPGARIFGLNSAGKVHVVYGSTSRLTTVANTYWHQDRPSIHDVVEGDDRFASSLGR